MNTMEELQEWSMSLYQHKPSVTPQVFVKVITIQKVMFRLLYKQKRRDIEIAKNRAIRDIIVYLVQIILWGAFLLYLLVGLWVKMHSN